ncbi:hypothetical protein E1A91_D10G063300v1 [Gossypium mustelinum]|uniref:Uncharacterized protein n=1 Tax=Gossypium mustelinum TaxID=34275 RepID=A0A5D2T6F3_GOSMU|nr:hypothetical protein E1A91_D10G063300v1 [Gossypium mustelinum]
MENQEQGKQSFSSRLTRNEVEDRIILFSYAVVAEFFEFQENRMFYMDIMDSLGKEWTFVGSFYTNQEVGNYVSISLLQFFTEKGLKPNDEVTFTKIPQGEDEWTWKKFKVEIKRKITLFGQEIWGELVV